MKEQRPVILVIDDSPSVLEFTSAAFNEKGYNVITALDGVQGITIAGTSDPDLILLDITMPGMDGFDVCSKLKSMPLLKETPVIFLTANTESDYIVKGLERGAVDYITKPFKKEELLARVRTHIDLAASKKQISLLSMAVEQSANLIVITDTEGNIEYVNEAFCAVTGFSMEESIGKNPRILKSELMEQSVYVSLWNTISSGKVWRGELLNRNKAGGTFWVSASINPIVNSSGEIIRFLSIQEDITEKKKLEEELHYHATTDLMTGTYNRHTGIEMLRKQIQLYKRLNKPLVAAFIDLNDLKYFNDHFGHTDGDQYLKTVVDKINSTVRESDTLCRMGGDEFLIIMPDCTLDCSISIMNRLVEKMEKINSSGALKYPVSISYGAAEYDPVIDRDISALIERADNGMYAYKKAYKEKMKGGSI
jgi:diguanylate cyclase (GGDEF)-like protein/PAS domain S-box-containing protein